MQNIDTVLSEHTRVMLQFSGGMNSLAILYLCQSAWDKIVAVWCNAGDELPETMAVIEAVKKLPIKFLEVRPVIPQPISIQRYGVPSDVVALRNTHDYAYLAGRDMTGVALQHPMSCCERLLFRPLMDAVREYGATLVVRGQRLSESMVSPVRSGDIVDGVEFLMPLERWSRAQVWEYLTDIEVEIPAYYQHVAHSLDCATCTAFLDQSRDKIKYLKTHHPAKYDIVHDRLSRIKESVKNEYLHLIKAVEI